MISQARVEKVTRIIMNKHDVECLIRASEILNELNNDYDCSKAVEENCSYDLGTLCISLDEFMAIVQKE
jgi:hypothetical protein